ncbi:MAG: hypothetical protein WKF77_00640 [Planctomycetaceae bacterium]
MRNRVFAVIGLVLIGAVLIGAGAVALSYRGIPYASRDVIIDAGTTAATAESDRTWPVPAAVSGLAVVCGILLIGFGSCKG